MSWFGKMTGSRTTKVHNIKGSCSFYPNSVMTLCILTVAFLAAGCTKHWYTVGGQKYSNRDEADAAYETILADALNTCRVSDTTAGDHCILVIPTRTWLSDNYLISKGDAETQDFALTYLERHIATQYAMIQKSNVFRQCEIVTAREGNGEGEGLASGGSFEVRAELREADRTRIYRLSGPGGTKSKLFGPRDVDGFAVHGWDWMVSAIHEVSTE